MYIFEKGKKNNIVKSSKGLGVYTLTGKTSTLAHGGAIGLGFRGKYSTSNWVTKYALFAMHDVRSRPLIFQLKR